VTIEQRKAIVEYLREAISQPFRLGFNDCNTMGGRILVILHNNQLTKDWLEFGTKHPKQFMKEYSFSTHLKELNYELVNDSPRIGDFVIQRGKHKDDVSFVYSTNRAVAPVYERFKERKRKVMDVELKSLIANNREVFRCQV